MIQDRPILKFLPAGGKRRLQLLPLLAHIFPLFRTRQLFDHRVVITDRNVMDPAEIAYSRCSSSAIQIERQQPSAILSA